MPGHVGLEHDVVERDVALHQQVVDRQVEVVRVDAEPDRQRALRVEVDQQHPRPYSASAAPRLIVVVVLPTPPFWLHIAMIRAGPCWSVRLRLGEDAAAAGRSGRSAGSRSGSATGAGCGRVRPGVQPTAGDARCHVLPALGRVGRVRAAPAGGLVGRHSAVGCSTVPSSVVDRRPVARTDLATRQ